MSAAGDNALNASVAALLRSQRVIIVGAGEAALAVAGALLAEKFIELRDFALIAPRKGQSPPGAELGVVDHRFVLRVYVSAVGFGAGGIDLTLMTGIGEIAAQNIVVADDDIWWRSGLSARQWDSAGAADDGGSRVLHRGSPVPGLFTIGYPEEARRSPTFDLRAAAARIARLIAAPK